MKTKFSMKKTLALVLSVAVIMGLVSIPAAAEKGRMNAYTFIEGIYAFSESRAGKTPDNSYQIFVYNLDDASADFYNRSRLFCSYQRKVSGTIGVPSKVRDNDTWDMDPFVFQDGDLVVAWTDATKSFNKNTTANEIAGTMRISVAAYKDPEGLQYRVSNNSSYTSDSVCTYSPTVTRIGGKLLVSWIVCHDIENDAGSYGIEGLYFDPENDTFYAENNAQDADGNPIPMVFAKDCNYISSYAIGEENNQTVVILEEATKETHVSDIMYDRVMKTDYSLLHGNSEINTIKLSANGGSIVVPLTDGKSYASVVDSDISALDYYYKNKLYRVTMDTQGKISSEEIGDVSRTGDTRYSIISENGSPKYFTGLELESQNICFYYMNLDTQKLDTLSQRLYDGDGRKFRSYPAIIASFEPDTFAAICMVCDPGDNNYRLEYVEFDKDYLFRADYSKVKEAIDKASSLNSADYKNFSEVTKAIDSVVYDKEYPEQKIVDGYAKAIEDALGALEYIDADYSAVDEAIAKAGKLDKDLYEDFSDVTAAINAVERGKNLTEQQAVDEMAKAIENAIDSLKLKAAPKIIEGANQTVKQGNSAAFKSNADFSYFKYVLVDGKQISSDSYTLKEGSTIVTLKSEFVNTLSVGKHTLSIVSKTGSADTEFTVEKAALPSETGETVANTKDGNMVLLTAAFVTLSGGMLIAAQKRRKLEK